MKYLHNFLQMWWCLCALLVGTLLVLYGIIRSLLAPAFRRGIWFAGAGTILVVMALFWVLGFNDTAYYPSLLDAQSSLTIRNSSSSHFTLTAMSVASLMVPFVVAYIFYAWRAMDRKSLTATELSALDEDDKY